MLLADIDEHAQLILQDKKLCEVEFENVKYISVNGMVPIPIFPLQKHAAEKGVYEIRVLDDGEEVGSVCLTSKMQNSHKISSFTENQYIAYIGNTDITSFVNGVHPVFSCDYIVLKVEYLNKYKRIMKSSPVWGGFTHTFYQYNKELYPDAAETAINIDIECHPRTDRHQNCLDMAARAQHPTQRFLYFYHFLELDYDYEIVRKIKETDENNTQGLWSILKSSREDLDRIMHILDGYNNIDALERIFLKIKNYTDSAVQIFYNYGKDSNPLADKHAFIEYFIKSPIISKEEFQRIKRENNLVDNFSSKIEDYDRKMLKLACYWIYRVRCCITHNKIGEYYLQSEDDFKFLVGFAEPLVIEMIKYRMKKCAE